MARTARGSLAGWRRQAIRRIEAVRRSTLAFAGGRLAPERLRRYGRRVRCTHHFWIVRGLSLLLEGIAAVDRRFGWPLYPAVFDAYFRFMHLLLLRVARPLSSTSDA